MSKKVLLLTASYGTGHITATKSLDEAFRKLYPEVETKTLDFLKINGGTQTQLTFFQKLYNFSMERPILFDILFNLTNNEFCRFTLEKMMILNYYKKVKKIFDEYQPDIFVSSHPYWNFLVKKYKREKDIPYVCIVTDSYMIHKAWIDSSVNYYCVIDEDSKYVLINNGIKNIIVTGFPVNPKLFEEIDRQKILSELKLDRDRITILVAIGLGAVERFLEIIEFLRVKKEDFQLIVVCGKYQDVYQKLKNEEFIPPTAIIGWTDRMHDFIRASDLVICKGGGAIVSESLSAKKPVFIPLFVPGQEKGNVYIVEKYKMGFHEEDINKIFSKLEEIISKRINLKEYQDNIAKYIKPNPSYKIANFVYKMITK